MRNYSMYFTPDATAVTVTLEMSANSDQLFRDFLKCKGRTKHWIIRNLVGTEKFPQFGPYFAIIDLENYTWELKAYDPYGSVKDGTHSEGYVLDLGVVRSLIEVITNEHVEKTMRELNAAQKEN